MYFDRAIHTDSPFDFVTRARKNYLISFESQCPVITARYRKCDSKHETHHAKCFFDTAHTHIDTSIQYRKECLYDRNEQWEHRIDLAFLSIIKKKQKHLHNGLAQLYVRCKTKQRQCAHVTHFITVIWVYFLIVVCVNMKIVFFLPPGWQLNIYNGRSWNVHACAPQIFDERRKIVGTCTDICGLWSNTLNRSDPDLYTQDSIRS